MTSLSGWTIALLLVSAPLGCSPEEPLRASCEDGCISDSGPAPTSDAATFDDGTAIDEASPDTIASDTSPFDTGTDSDAASSCHDLANLGSAVFREKVAAPYPTFTGGIITPGTYVLTKSVSYTGVGGETGTETSTRRVTRLLTTSTPPYAAGPWSCETVSDSADAGTERRTATFYRSDTHLGFNETCPGMNSGTTWFDYTATSTTLEIGFPTVVETYSRE
ncbi:MAG: hypothetical protein ACXVEF_30285 [Polyangiales bacterium]